MCERAVGSAKCGCVLAEEDTREQVLVDVVDGLAEPLAEVLLSLSLELRIQLAGELVL